MSVCYVDNFIAKFKIICCITIPFYTDWEVELRKNTKKPVFSVFCVLKFAGIYSLLLIGLTSKMVTTATKQSIPQIVKA